MSGPHEERWIGSAAAAAAAACASSALPSRRSHRRPLVCSLLSPFPPHPLDHASAQGTWLFPPSFQLSCRGAMTSSAKDHHQLHAGHGRPDKQQIRISTRTGRRHRRTYRRPRTQRHGLCAPVMPVPTLAPASPPALHFLCHPLCHRASFCRLSISSRHPGGGAGGLSTCQPYCCYCYFRCGLWLQRASRTARGRQREIL